MLHAVIEHHTTIDMMTPQRAATARAPCRQRQQRTLCAAVMRLYAVCRAARYWR